MGCQNADTQSGIVGKAASFEECSPSRRNRLSLLTNLAPGRVNRLTRVLVLPANLSPRMQIPVSFQMRGRVERQPALFTMSE